MTSDSNLSMQEFHKAKTSRVISAIISDQQRRRACDSLLAESTIPCTSYAGRCNLEQVCDNSPLPDSLSPNKECMLSYPIHPTASSMSTTYFEFRSFKENSPEYRTCVRKKRFQFQGTKCTNGSESLPPEFLEGLLMFAPNRRDSLLKNFNESINFSIDIKETNHETTVANVSYPWRLPR
jgi:hypothetical protein